jgi:hypothetical protein
MDTDEAMDDADAYIYTTTIIMHGEREAKTEDNNRSSAAESEVLRQASLAGSFSRPRKPEDHVAEVGSALRQAMERTYIQGNQNLYFQNMNKVCVPLIFVVFMYLVHWHARIVFFLAEKFLACDFSSQTQPQSFFVFRF